jgi:hypothetical protein
MSLLDSRIPEAERDPQSGRYVLTISRRYLGASILKSCCILAVLALNLMNFSRNPRVILVPICLFGFLLLFALAGVKDASARLSFTEEGLYVGRGWMGEEFVPWSAITAITYSNFRNALVFHAPGYRTVRISVYRNGLYTFAKMANHGLVASPLGKAPYLLFQKAENPR